MFSDIVIEYAEGIGKRTGQEIVADFAKRIGGSVEQAQIAMNALEVAYWQSITENPARCASCGLSRASTVLSARRRNVSDPICCEVVL